MTVVNTGDPAATPSVAASDFTGDAYATTLRGAAQAYRDRLRGGDMGPLPAVLGLIDVLPDRGGSI